MEKTMTKTVLSFVDMAGAAREKLVMAADPGKVNMRALGTATNSIRAAGAKLDAAIHAAAYACLMVARADNNGEPARQLVTAMPKAARAKTLADWFEAHSNVRLRMDKASKEWAVGMAKGKDMLDHAALADLMAIAWSKPFFTVEEKTAGARAFSLADSFKHFLDRAAKQAEAGNVGDMDKAFIVQMRKAGIEAGLIAASC